MYRVRQKIALPMALAIMVLLLTLRFAPAQDSSGPDKDLKPTVILVSIDGFHPDYLNRYSAPTLSMLARQGVRARWMTPVYPSLTFPNHYSIATGLYPDNHGIVGNNIYDPEFKQTFSLSKREEVQNGRWWLGEPIWVSVNIFPKPGMEQAIYSTLKSKAPPQVKVYRKQDAPSRLHYGRSRRIGEVVVMADEGWTIVSRERYRPPARAANGGAHGYDNRLESMRAIFVGLGPAFKQSQVVEPFENVDVYNVMAEILGLKPSSNDGGHAAARAVLRSQQ
jgi:predicted AlkP superfamily pyrophosphatase or phosphodiesterase